MPGGALLPDRKGPHVNTDALESFAAGRPAKPEWTPPTLEGMDPGDFYGRQVIAFDPSLSGCAGVLLTFGLVWGKPQLTVLAARKFTTSDHGAGGYEESLRKTLELSHLIEDWVLTAAAGYGLSRVEFVHEGPPVGGGSLIRPEATLLGGAALRFALDRNDLFPARCQPMVQPQTHKAFICGPAARKKGFDKKAHHAVLMPLVASWGVQGLDLITNADLRDALSVAVFQLSREGVTND